MKIRNYVIDRFGEISGPNKFTVGPNDSNYNPRFVLVLTTTHVLDRVGESRDYKGAGTANQLAHAVVTIMLIEFHITGRNRTN